VTCGADDAGAQDRFSLVSPLEHRPGEVARLVMHRAGWSLVVHPLLRLSLARHSIKDISCSIFEVIGIRPDKRQRCRTETAHIASPRSASPSMSRRAARDLFFPLARRRLAPLA